MKTKCLLFLFACVALHASPAQTANRFSSLPGLIFEAEDWSEPRNGWTTNKVTENQWRLWTTEGPGKRSRDASLVSPVIKKDRATPQEGAPVLHTRITKIPAGTYQAWLGPSPRPLAYSLDGGKTWLQSGAGETDLGIYQITNSLFELWVDDRFAHPKAIGSCYYDYIRLEPYQPPVLSQLTVFTLPDGNTQISWTSAKPAPAATVKCANREFHEPDLGLRNHRVILTGLPAGQSFDAQICFAKAVAQTVKFVAGQRPTPPPTKSLDLPLAVSELTEQGRAGWPVTAGIPFAAGELAAPEHFFIADSKGAPVQADGQAWDRWPDGSVKWLTVNFLANTTGKQVAQYTLHTGASVPANERRAAMVRDEGARLKVDNGRLAFVCDKKRFTLFDSFTLDGQPVSGAPTNGNGRIVDAAGKIYWLAPADRVEIEENGQVRAVIKAEGDFAAEDGARLFHWRARYFIFQNQPWVRLSWTIGNNQTNIVMTHLTSAGVRLPFAASGEMLGSLNLAPAAPVKDDKSCWLLQDKDDRFTASTAAGTQTGARAQGCASVRDASRQMTVVVKDFWQTYPKGFSLQRDGIHVRVLPPLPADAFTKESQNDEDLIRLYYCYDKGQYLVKRGLEFTTDIFVRFDNLNDPAKPAEGRAAEWFQNPLFAAAPPAHYCRSGVFGTVEPQQAGLFDGYEKLAEAGFNTIEKNRETKHEYGWMNYGDWHGERHFNWGNQEYDLMGALALQFIRTADTKWLWRAAQATRHNTDIDTIHFPWQTRMAGLVYAHSVGHVGEFFDKTDSRFKRLGNVFGLSDASKPNPFVAGAIDTGGHIFQPGNFRLGFLTGERRFLEVAEQVCAAQATYFTINFDFGIERAAGWPLMNAVAAYEGTGNPFYLNAARLYAEKILGKQSERGDWNLPHGLPECPHTPGHAGGKAFATGILLNGLMMYDTVAPSPEVKRCIVRSAHWLEKYSWNKETHGYRYIDTCPKFDKASGNASTDLLVASGLAYACTLDPDPALRRLLMESVSQSMTSSPKDGKGYAQCIRQAPHALAIMHQKLDVKELKK